MRKVDTKGIITTFAGNGAHPQPGFWGDGGAATDAQIHSPVAVAIDKAGKVYIVAAADNTIRMVDTDGVISIFAGEGYKGFYGDTDRRPTSPASPARRICTFLSDGSALVADTGNATIRKVATDGTISTVPATPLRHCAGDDVATKLAMIAPFGVTADSSGNFYIAEFGTQPHPQGRYRRATSRPRSATASGLRGRWRSAE